MDELKNKQKIRQMKKRKNRREVLLIIVMVVCLALGYFAGYMSKKTTVVENNNSENIVDEVYETLRDHWVNANDQEMDFDSALVNGMVSGLSDQHSQHFTTDQASSFNESVAGNVQGIGVGYSPVEKGAMITKVYDDSPAQEAGLQVGDIITVADGHELAGASSDQVKEYVRGDNGTQVTLTLLRNKETFNKEVTRRSLDTSTAYEIKKAGQQSFGYIELTTFGVDTASQVETALKYFKEHQIETLVLDLRDNGGGYLTAAEGILDLFFDSKEVIYQMQLKNDAAQKFYASSDNVYSFDQGYILVNGNTASASELTAGALQSEKGYKLIGEQTYGKGTAQTQKTLSDGSVLKYTYAKWMIPNGTCIDGKGLTPDVKVENVSLDDISMAEVKGTLQVDSVSARVKSMQKMLNILGYGVDREDGYFSVATSEALKKFESDNHLTADGQYDENDKLMLVARIMIYLNNHENDKQYDKLIEILK